MNALCGESSLMTHKEKIPLHLTSVKLQSPLLQERESPCCSMLACHSSCKNVWVKNTSIRKSIMKSNKLFQRIRRDFLPILELTCVYIKWFDFSFFCATWTTAIPWVWELIFFYLSFDCWLHSHIIKNHWTRARKTIIPSL